MHGSIVDLLGLNLDLVASTIKIGGKTLLRVAAKLRTFEVREGKDGFGYKIDVLESLLGSLNFLCDCSSLGRTQTSRY